MSTKKKKNACEREGVAGVLLCLEKPHCPTWRKGDIWETFSVLVLFLLLFFSQHVFGKHMTPSLASDTDGKPAYSGCFRLNFTFMLIWTLNTQEVGYQSGHTGFHFHPHPLQTMENVLNSLQKYYKHDVNPVLQFIRVKFGTSSITSCSQTRLLTHFKFSRFDEVTLNMSPL